MNLRNLIKKYEKELTIYDTSTEGRYENGKWVPPDPVKRKFKGALIPLTTEDLKLYEAGTYTTQDMKLYVCDFVGVDGLPLGITQGEIVEKSEDKQYNVMESLDVTEVVGYAKHVLKKVV